MVLHTYILLSMCFSCHFMGLCYFLCSVPQNLVVINGSNWEEAKRTQAFDQSVRCLAACRLISSISKVASLLCFPILDNRIPEAFCHNFLLLKLHFVTSWTHIQNVSCRCSLQVYKVAKWGLPHPFASFVALHIAPHIVPHIAPHIAPHIVPHIAPHIVPNIAPHIALPPP